MAAPLGRGPDRPVENHVDPRETVAIHNYTMKIQEAEEEIQQHRWRIDEYDAIIDRLAREELRN